MHLSGLDQFFWAATFAGHIALLAVLWTRRRAAKFPAFTTLISFYAARTIALYVLLHLVDRHAQRDYFYAYWSMAVVDEMLQVIVFYELARKVFCPTGVWARDVRRAFLWMTGISAIVATVLTSLASPAAPRLIQVVMLRSDFFTSALMSELFVGMMALSAIVGLPWRTHVARIAQGFGVFAVVCVLLYTADNYFGLAQGSRVYDALSLFRRSIYAGCLGYWIVTLWQEAPAPRELPEAMRMQIYTLQRRVEYDLIRIRSWRRS